MAVINLWELSFTMAFMNLLRLGAAIPPQYPITTPSVFGGQPSERGYGILEVPADCNMHSEHSGCPENYFCYMHTCIYYPPNTPPPGCGDGRKGLWRSDLQIKIAEDSGQHDYIKESQYSSQDPGLDEPKMSLCIRVVGDNHKELRPEGDGLRSAEQRIDGIRPPKGSMIHFVYKVV
ncbi:hypothetical protein BKA61DRAFT_569233 [Leptodontidium sp. MPI-SDFR-AT-0119]|nr:hypothetical protein BKA61DRAFT_569233 [Leptodontidium sp. MPI-SDFR-AT-0119]